MPEVTHKDLDEVRRELHSDHAGLAARMSDDFSRVYNKLDELKASRTRIVLWTIGIIVGVVGALMGVVYESAGQVAEAMNIHLQHSARYTEKIEQNAIEIEHNRERHNILESRVHVIENGDL